MFTRNHLQEYRDKGFCVVRDAFAPDEIEAVREALPALFAEQSPRRIVEKGSLTAAAASLGTSLPAMVCTLAALERELGATLLQRTTRRLHLTDEGRQYLAQCRAILAQVQEAEAMLQQLSAEARLVVSEPLGDLPGAWNALPESTAAWIRPGDDELVPFQPIAS